MRVGSIGVAAVKPRRSRADLAEHAWIWAVVGYSALRFIVAWGAFGDHGVNPWIFGLIDIATAWPYAKSVAVVCRRSARGEWSRLPGPIAVAISTFFAPYAYLWFAAGEMPTNLRLMLTVFVTVLAAAATLGVVTKSRRMRRAMEPVAETTDVSTPVEVPAASEPAVLAEQPEQAVAVETPDIDLRSEPRTIRPPALVIDLTGEHPSVQRPETSGSETKRP